MDELLKQIALDQAGQILTYRDFLLAVAFSAIFSSITVWVYRYTHSGLSYSRSFGVSMILMSVTIAFIMMIIGSNLARAFSLVGALSIVRYRNALKESRDTAFIFLSLAIGMACGVKLFGMAALFTTFSLILLILLEKIKFGSAVYNERLLQITLPNENSRIKDLEEKLKKITKGRYSLISAEVSNNCKVVTYSVELEKKHMNIDFVSEFGEDAKLIAGYDRFNF